MGRGIFDVEVLILARSALRCQYSATMDAFKITIRKFIPSLGIFGLLIVYPQIPFRVLPESMHREELDFRLRRRPVFTPCIPFVEHKAPGDNEFFLRGRMLHDSILSPWCALLCSRTRSLHWLRATHTTAVVSLTGKLRDHLVYEFAHETDLMAIVGERLGAIRCGLPRHRCLGGHRYDCLGGEHRHDDPQI